VVAVWVGIKGAAARAAQTTLRTAGANEVSAEDRNECAPPSRLGLWRLSP